MVINELKEVELMRAVAVDALADRAWPWPQRQPAASWLQLRQHRGTTSSKNIARRSFPTPKKSS